MPINQKSMSTAVAKLIQSDNYRPLKAKLLQAIQQYPRVPMKFDGDLADLNPLLELGVAKPLQFEKVFDVITARRREMAYNNEEERRGKRNDYMKDYMREYRSKVKKERVKSARGSPNTTSGKKNLDIDLSNILK